MRITVPSPPGRGRRCAPGEGALVALPVAARSLSADKSGRTPERYASARFRPAYLCRAVPIATEERPG
jgi:hypothetical protein